jgi:hypothetical protein
MIGKALTIFPLLVLSGLFFAAGILQAGILFLVFAALMLWAYLRPHARPALPAEETAETPLGEAGRR